MDFHGPRNVWAILQVNWEAAALQSNWFQDGFRCRTDSTRCFMIRNWDIWIHEIDAKERCWLKGCTQNFNAWLVWIHGNEVAGRSTFAASKLFTYVRFKFSRLKLLGDGFREALDIWKKPMYFMDFIMGFVAHYDMMGWHRLTSCWKPQGWGRIYKQPNTQSFEHDSLTCIKCQIHWGDWAVFSAQIW